jgi:hypothetical protein
MWCEIQNNEKLLKKKFKYVLYVVIVYLIFVIFDGLCVCSTIRTISIRGKSENHDPNALHNISGMHIKF